MNWYKRKVSQTDNAWGYWLLPDGTMNEVPFEGHEQTAMKMGYDGYIGAYRAGLVSVTTTNPQMMNPYLFIQGLKFTPQQRVELEKTIHKANIESSGKCMFSITRDVFGTDNAKRTTDPREAILSLL